MTNNNFWQTETWFEYLLNSRNDMSYIDRSFYLDGQFIPLLQDAQELFSPGFDDDKNILQHIREISQKHNIKRIQVNSHIKSYLNISGYTCIINIFRDITPTKGHKSAINRAKKHLSYTTAYDINKFKLDYFRIASKQTRPDKTFQILDKWRNAGIGTLFTAKLGDIVVGHAYILHYTGWGYYFMGCVEPDYKQYNVSHYLQSIIFENACCKIQKYEIGEQVYNSLLCQPTQKELNISKFKRGFGGYIDISPRSEYFFDKAYFIETMQKRINNYAEAEYEKNNIILP